MAGAAVTVAMLVLSGGALAHSGEFARFDNCPSTNEAVKRCLNSVTVGGTFVLGKKTVPIVNPVTLQGGYSAPNEETGFATFYEATNGVTLSKTPQPVPGGLAGLVNCKEISNFLLRASCELTFENGLTGVNSTLELALPASAIKVSQLNLVSEEGVALQLPVKVHLENPLLGGSCYIGSSSSPIILNLTTGATVPPPPTTPIHGAEGAVEILEEGRITHLIGNELVDNSWSAPGASGCGGFPFELLLNPIINSSVGVPSAAGKNKAVLVNSAYLATAAAVNSH
jgi:hypothetical protein